MLPSSDLFTVDCFPLNKKQFLTKIIAYEAYSTPGNGVEPKRCLGWVFNSKLGHIGRKNGYSMAYIQSLL
jgi:hypothetical protein